MITKFSKGIVALTAIVAAAALTLVGPANAQGGIAAGFESNGTTDVGFAWNVNSGAVSKAVNGVGGSSTAFFGVSANGSNFVGIADNGSTGYFEGASWNGVNGGATGASFFDSGNSQGFPGNDNPWSINNSGNAVGQGVGQIAGYDQGDFAGIEWTSGGSAIVDLNSLNDPAGAAINGSSYYGGPVYIEGYDTTGGEVGEGAGINTNGQISGTSFQNFGNFYYQGVIASAGKVYVIPYTDSSDPAATSWGISEAGATEGYNFEDSLATAYGYTASVTTSGYSFGANGGTGLLANYGTGPANTFQWFLANNDNGSGNGQAVGFDIDPTDSFNQAVYDANDHTSVAVASTAGGTTTFLAGVGGDGTSAGFQTISADGGADFHAFGTKTGTPGATTTYTEGSGIVGSKAFGVSAGSGGGGLSVTTFTGAEKTKKGKATFKAIALKHGKTAKVSIVLSGNGPQVVTVTSSNTADLANFTATVPGGQNFVYNVKTPKVSTKAKGATITLTASAPGGSQSVTVTIK